MASDMTHTQLSTRAFWICAIITVVSAVVSASFSVTALIGVARLFGCGYAAMVIACLQLNEGGRPPRSLSTWIGK